MAVEQTITNPLDIDLLDRRVDEKLGIQNTIRLWTPLHERTIALARAFPVREVRRSLYFAGYNAAEVSEQEGVYIRAVQQSIEGARRAPNITRLRSAFNGHEGRGWRMDEIVEILRDFASGLTSPQVAEKHGHDKSLLARKRRSLVEAGFMEPDPERKPSLKKLIESPDWEKLSLVVRDIRGSGYRCLEGLYQTLIGFPSDKRFKVERQTRAKFDGYPYAQNYYFLHTSEVDRLRKLFEENPKLGKV